VIGTDNVSGGSVYSNPSSGDGKEGTALANKVDLFGWSTSATNFGVSTSTNQETYYGSFVDWGTNVISDNAPNTWRTLTYKEWYYLLHTRTNADALCGVAQVNGVNGLVFLPDNWICPASITFKSGFYGVYAAYQTFTADQWAELEASGAIFLPASGVRFGLHVVLVQLEGQYWSATEFNGNDVSFFYISSFEANMYSTTRTFGRSVRLVKDL
jgi:hypothetical protein